MPCQKQDHGRFLPLLPLSSSPNHPESEAESRSCLKAAAEAALQTVSFAQTEEIPLLETRRRLGETAVLQCQRPADMHTARRGWCSSGWKKQESLRVCVGNGLLSGTEQNGNIQGLPLQSVESPDFSHSPAAQPSAKWEILLNQPATLWVPARPGHTAQKTEVSSCWKWKTTFYNISVPGNLRNKQNQTRKPPLQRLCFNRRLAWGEQQALHQHLSVAFSRFTLEESLDFTRCSFCLSYNPGT